MIGPNPCVELGIVWENQKGQFQKKVNDRKSQVQIILLGNISFRETKHQQIEARANGQSKGFRKINQEKTVDNVTGVHQKNFREHSDDTQQHQSMKQV